MFTRLISLSLVWLFLSGLWVSAQEDPSEALQDVLEAYVGESDPAVVLHIVTPDFSWAGARGLADIPVDIPVEIGDHFRIASVTKTFVSTLVLQLVDEGLLALDDPMSLYLPDEIIGTIANSDDITIRQLLNMTSGVYNYTESEAFFAAVENAPGHPWLPHETLTFLTGQEAYFPPGEGYYYSNSNYILLQLVIESVAGSSLADALQARIFEPLGMSESFLESAAELGLGLVNGYQESDDGYEDVTLINDGIGLGDGGIVSTVEDLALFPRALFSGELISDAALDEMLTLVEDDEGGLYGLGIVCFEGIWGEVYGHTGASSGFQSEMWYLPDQDTVVVALTNNFDSEILPFLVDDALRAVLGEEA